MEKPVRMLEKPIARFSSEDAGFHQVLPYQVADVSPFFWESDCLIVYVKSGRGLARVNQMPCKIGPGSIGVLHSYHVFRFEAEGTDPLTLELLRYPYPEIVLMDIVPLESPQDYARVCYGAPFVSLGGPEQKRYADTVAALRAEYGKEANNTLVPNCLLMQISMLYYDEVQKAAAPRVPLCAELYFYIASHSFSDVTIEEVAEKFRITTRQVNQELRRVCGADFHTALIHSRLSNAYSMMLRTNLSMKTLSKEAGFASEASFYRIFREAYSITPNQYRAHLQEQLGIWQTEINDDLLGIESYILNHFQETISISSCARALFSSAETINQILRGKYGPESSFNTFLAGVRVRYAEGLLTMSTIPIIDVALDSGFNSVHTFIRTFKKQTQMTPSEYRNLYLYKEGEHG